MKKEMKVNPWEVSGDVDYNKLMKDFGVTLIDDKMSSKIQNLHPLIRRGLYFAHRDFDKWLRAQKEGKKVSVITGRGPSERMHIGHLIPFLIAKSLQDEFGCDVYIPISDDEKFFVKNDLTYEKSLEYAKENILDLIALGFDPKKTFVFQDFVYTNIYVYAARIAKKMTYNMAKSTFGLKPEQNIGWSFYPAMQAAHILFPQFHSKKKHISVVPVGIDQDPFIRLTRDIAVNKDFNLEKPAAIHAKFLPSLDGGAKMSSSGNHVIFLSDSSSEVKNKINKYAFSGGKETLEEHRKLGGNPDVDVSFQYLKYVFEEDDKKLDEIEKKYRSGEMLTGELKKYTIEKISNFLSEHQKKREIAKKNFDKFILKN